MKRNQEELQFLGFFSTLKETFKIIFSWKKIFAQIMLAFVIPLSLVLLLQMRVTNFLYWKVWYGQRVLRCATSSTHQNRGSYYINNYDHQPESLKIAYYIVDLVFSLQATSVVAYSVASVYTDKPVAFKKVIGVVPKVWKRSLVTFLWTSAIIFVLKMLAFAISYMSHVNLGFGNAFGSVVFVVLLAVFVVAVIYLCVVLRVACVISVMEEDYGVLALFKSMRLIKGKTGLSTGLVFLLLVFYQGIMIVYQIFTWYSGVRFGMFGSVLVVGIPCCLFLAFVMLVDLVLQTIIYFICKSYHNESIDKLKEI